jgi:hypothetical protein
MLSAAGQLKRSANQFNDEWKSTKVQWIKSKAAELGIEVSVTPETFIDWTKDGVSLMEFVEALSAAVLSEEVEFPRYRKNASLFAHKLDNFAQLVSYLRRHHKFEGEVTGEDLVNGVPKKLEILFQALESWQQLNASLRSVHIEEDKEI